jgi:hypothetical protein
MEHRAWREEGKRKEAQRIGQSVKRVIHRLHGFTQIMKGKDKRRFLTQRQVRERLKA